ncbi:MAG TPA: PAS domain-containing protein [Gemmataceae bacterium]|nr:PAS domain-containing protein [Gemmataceae bacterium]
MGSPNENTHVSTEVDDSANWQVIAPRAFDKWVQKGCPTNSQLQDWLEAEAELVHQHTEESLKNSEALYHSLVENLPQSIFRKDKLGRFTFVNQHFQDALGLPREEILGKTDFDFYPPELAHKYRQDDLRVMESGQVFETVEENLDAAGKRIYVQVVKTPLHNFRGHVVGTQCIFWDVTEKKLAEEALRDREQRLELALQAGSMGTWEWHIPSGQVEWSTNLEIIHGFAPGTFGGTLEAVIEQVHPGDRALVQKAIVRALETRSFLDLEYRLHLPDGRIRWVEGRGQLFLDEAGRPERMLGVCMDITQRKQAEETLLVAEEALRKSHDMLQAITEGTTDAIFVKDRRGRYLMLNSAGARLIGKSVAELLGKDDTALFSPDSAKVIMEGDQRVMASGEIQTYEDVGTAAGVTRTYLSTKGPYRDQEGHVIGLIGISRDITERRQAEKHLHERDMEFRLAQEIQQSMLPAHPPALCGFCLGSGYQSAQETGGDYLDFIPMPEDHLGIVIGDASGHGIGAALLMAQARAYLRAFALTHKNVSKTLALANRRLSQDMQDSIESHFVTLLLARLQPRTRRLVYCNAGHSPAYVFDARGDVKSVMHSSAFPLGINVRGFYPLTSTLFLEPGDLVFLYTDGVVDAMSVEDKSFGLQRALDFVRSRRHLPPADIVAQLLDEISKFSEGQRQIDDRSAIILKVE